MAEVVVVISDGALGPSERSPRMGVGAWVVFEGVVRPEEGDETIEGLDYEVYESMAEKQLMRLANEVAAAHDLIEIVVEHSRGRVAVGACSFRLSVGAKHRAPALAAMAAFIDAMKRDVPIWKRVVSAADG